VTHPIAAAAAAAAVSPLLASFSVALSAGVGAGWWRPGPVSVRRYLVVAAAAIVLAVLASAGRPAVAWWLWATGGAVLIVVDVRTHRLPARFTYPLAAAVGAALVGSAVLAADPADLARAGLAAAVVGGGYLAVRFVSPAALGQGDVRTAALAGAVAGSTGWAAVGQAQLLTAVLGGVTAVVLKCRPTAQFTRTGQVPLGPAIIVGPLLTGWL